MQAWLRQYHRWLGLFAALPVLLWGLSGLSHPIMSRLQVQPAETMAPSALVSGFSHAQLHSALPLATVLQSQGIAAVRDARLLKVGSRLLWQVTLPGQAERRYFEARSGQAVAGYDRALAVQLARHFVGAEHGAVRRVQLLTDFTDDYPAVNRLLPVYRVDFAGAAGLRAYVETSPLRLATINDDTKALFITLFRTLHSWAFIPSEGLRDAVMSGFLLAGLAAAIGGVWLYGLGRRRTDTARAVPPLRRWHRRLGLALVLVTMAFCLSALLHLWLINKASAARPLNAGYKLLLAERLRLAPLEAQPAAHEQLALVSVAGAPYFRLSPVSGGPARAGGEHQHHAVMATDPDRAAVRYVSAEDGRALVLAEQVQVRALAGRYSGLPATDIVGLSPVQQFGGEYGFINKRLPVVKVDYATPDHLSVYVEPATGVIAAVVRDRDRIEGYSFANLHKWHFLDFAGKDARDLASGAAALGVVLTTGLGLGLYVRRRRALRARTAAVNDGVEVGV